MTQELRTLYVDSHWCERDASGGLALPLTEQMEVPSDDLVAFVDEFTISGQFTAVNASSKFEYYIDLLSTQGNNGAGICMVYRSDDGTQLAGTIYHGTVDMVTPADPLPAHDSVLMDFKYATGIGHWTAKFPYQTMEWGWEKYTNISTTGTNRKLRILTLPTLDYSASTFRPVLEDLLNEDAFTGTHPTGSGSKYAVSYTHLTLPTILLV